MQFSFTPAQKSAALFVALVVLLTPTATLAQVVRFETNAGSFDVTLNPTNNPNLQPHVDNFLQYVNGGLYNNTLLNRADEGFVIQLGGFIATQTTTIGFDASDATPIPAFNPVIVDADNDGQIDFDTTGLTNTRGQVSLALNVTGPNSGTSSFFVNLNDNSFLDALGFLPFAVIEDLAPIDAIENLQQTSFSFAGLAFSDVPTVNQTDFVIVEQAFVIPEPATASCLFSALCLLITQRSRRGGQ